MPERLTDTKILALRPKNQRYELRDTVVRGLYIEVGAKGDKVWWIQTSRGQKRERHRIGAFSKDLNSQKARALAESIKVSIRKPSASREVSTVVDLFELYRSSQVGKKRSWRDVQSVWDNWARDRIGHVKLQDLTAHHALDLRDHVAAKSSAIRASKVLNYIRPMFSWATRERRIDANPWVGVAVGETATSRDRVLSETEWQAIWQATYQEPYGDFFRFLMLSAQRKGNVASMRWDEIDGNVWTIPREKFKATRADKARAHEVPLSSALQSILDNRPRLGPYVFGVTGERPLTFGSRQKDRLGELAGVQDWRLHDLRRSAATRMAERKISRFVIERVLGHADIGVTAIYDRANYRDEKRAALEILARLDGRDQHNDGLL